MAKAESIIPTETRTPTPGTITHLDYLATMEDTLESVDTLEDFLALTQATRSLGLCIVRFRTIKPIQSPNIELDQRRFSDTKLTHRFTGAVYRNPIDPASGHITLAGERRLDDPELYSSEDERPDSDELLYSYGAWIPTNFNHTYDPSRLAEAVYSCLDADNRIKRSIFNQAANKADYPQEHSFAALRSVVSSAAADIMRSQGYEPGKLEVAPEIEPAGPEHVYWVPERDYLADDANEFSSPSKQW